MKGLVTVLAKYTVVIPYLVIAYFWWKSTKKQRNQILLFFVLVVAISALLAFIGQHLYVNPRPPFKDGSVPYFKPSDYNGFPSDHTLFASAAAFAVLRFKRTWGYWLLALSVFIGWMRVVAHVHHAIDVFGALLMTGLAYLISTKLVSYANTSRREPKNN